MFVIDANAFSCAFEAISPIPIRIVNVSLCWSLSVIKISLNIFLK